MPLPLLYAATENFLYSFFKDTYLFIYLLLATLGLPCCVQAFSSCSKWGLLSNSDAQASYLRWLPLLAQLVKNPPAMQETPV